MESITFIYKKHILRYLVCTALAVGLIPSPNFARGMAPEELLIMAEELMVKVSQIADEAEATDDYYMAQHAFALATEAAGWVGEVSAMSQQRSNSDLGRAAGNAANEIRKLIAQIQITARKIAGTNPDPDVVHAANFLFKSCELVLMQFCGPPTK